MEGGATHKVLKELAQLLLFLCLDKWKSLKNKFNYFLKVYYGFRENFEIYFCF